MVIKSGKQSGVPGAAVKKARSAAYPLLSLPRAAEAAKKIYENLGAGPHSREALARGLGYASFSGAASGKIGAMAHFGLLSRIAGRYSVTVRARAIFKYPDEGCLPQIVAAAIQPALFRALAARFDGEALPNDLEAILTADYGITQKAAPQAVANFVRTMELADMLKDGRLVLPQTDLPIMDSKPENDLEEPRAGEGKNIDAAGKENAIKIKLPSGVEIIFPDELAYRLSMGEFAVELKNLEKKARGVE